MPNSFYVCILAQDYLAGHNRGVCPQPIRLEIQSPDVPDLTIIDLPGLTEVAVEGQDPNIVSQVTNQSRDLVTNQIRDLVTNQIRDTVSRCPGSHDNRSAWTHRGGCGRPGS